MFILILEDELYNLLDAVTTTQVLHEVFTSFLSSFYVQAAALVVF
jgi:hypothetical protein